MGGGLIRKVGVDFEEMGLIRKLKKKHIQNPTRQIFGK